MRRSLFLAPVLALTLAACSSPEPRDDPAPPAGPATTVETGGTAPGTDLGLGEAAVLAWQPAQDVTGELELTVETVAEQRPSVFDGWVGDDAIAAARPYFVTVTVRNVGEADLGGQDVPLYLRDTRGSLGAPWTLDGDFAACQSGPLPARFEGGAETDMCLVYLVPDGGRVRDLVFEPTEGYDPITWSGEVQRPGKRERSRRG